MTLIKCRKCGAMVSDKADFCSICRTPVNQPKEETTNYSIRREKEIQPTPQTVVEPIHSAVETSKIVVENKNNIYLWVFTILVLLILGGSVGGYFYYQNIYLPEKIDREAPRYYTFSNMTNMRSSKMTGVDYNILTSIPYGSELITYSYDSEWADVKIDNQKGYISSNLLLNKSDFYRLNSIWGDTESKECILTTKCRRALLDYFKNKSYIGNLPDILLTETLPNFEKTNENQWQVFGRNAKPNSVFYPRISNKYSKFTDFAVLIKNISTGKRKLLLFSFDEDETPHLYYESDAPNEGYIQDIYFSINNVGEKQIFVDYTNS